MQPAIISYIPALHRGYIDFFKKYTGGNLYILGSDFIKQAPRLERDIRALTPEEIKTLVGALGIFSNIVILDEKNVKELLTNEASKSNTASSAQKINFVMPQDEVNQAFAEKYLLNKTIEVVPIFLRWNRQISTTEFEVAPDREISEAEFDKNIISETIKESEKSSDWWRQVGAALVRDKKVVLIKHNMAMPTDHTPNIFGDPRSNFDAQDVQYKELGKFIHGEARIISEAAKQGISTAGAAVYVSTFPCPACAKLVAAAGITELYYANGYSVLDAEDILKGAGVKLVMVNKKNQVK